MEDDKPTSPPTETPTTRQPTNTILHAAALRDQKANPELAPEIYLCQREDGVWVLPEAPYYHGDTRSDVLVRVEKEFDAEIQDVEPAGTKWDERPDVTILSEVFVVQLAYNPQEDGRHKWFAMDKLPPTLDTFQQYRLIPLAVEFRKRYAPK